jgi:hypothetical protein
MESTKTANGTFSNQAGMSSEGAYKQTSQTHGDLPAAPNVQVWPSYSGKPTRTGDMPGPKASKKSSGY